MHLSVCLASVCLSGGSRRKRIKHETTYAAGFPKRTPNLESLLLVKPSFFMVKQLSSQEICTSHDLYPRHLGSPPLHASTPSYHIHSHIRRRAVTLAQPSQAAALKGADLRTCEQLISQHPGTMIRNLDKHRHLPDFLKILRSKFDITCVCLQVRANQPTQHLKIFPLAEDLPALSLQGSISNPTPAVNINCVCRLPF